MERDRPLAPLASSPHLIVPASAGMTIGTDGPRKTTARQLASHPESGYDAEESGENSSGRVAMPVEEPEDFSTTSTFSRRTQITMILATALVCGVALAAMLVE